MRIARLSRSGGLRYALNALRSWYLSGGLSSLSAGVAIVT